MLPDVTPPPMQSRWLFRKIPALDSLRTYTSETFRRDLVAGFTVAAVAVPQAMAYASIVGLPVEYGLYTAIVMTAVGALFDSSKQLINGPTNAISIAVFSALGGLALVGVEDRIAAAILLAFMIGLIQTCIALLRLGDLTRYISHAVIVGFTTGAAILLLLDQTKNLLGLKAQGGPHDHFLVRLWMTLRQGGGIDMTTFAVGCGTIAFVLGMAWINRRSRRRVPELLLAVVLGAVVVWGLGLDKPRSQPDGTVRPAVSVIGTIPRSLPSFALPKVDWNHVQQLSGSALAIAMLGLLEAIAMAKAIAARTGDKLDLNQQCLSEGFANLAGSMFQCYAGSGSLTRSAINHQAGGMTQWSGVISAVVVAATLLLFAPFAYYIPRASLAGILMVSAFRMVDSHKLAFHMRATRMDAVIVLATAISAVAISVEFCILIGTFVSFMIYLPRAAKVGLTELVFTPEGIIRERTADEPRCNRLFIYNIDGELFFGSSTEFVDQLAMIEERTMGEAVRVVLLRVKYARNLDGVCLDILDRFIGRMDARGITVILCGVRESMYNVLKNVGWHERLGPERIFREGTAVWSSTLQAVHRAYQLINEDERCTNCPLKSGDPHDARSWYYMI